MDSDRVVRPPVVASNEMPGSGNPPWLMHRNALIRPAGRLKARLGLLVVVGALAGPAWPCRSAWAQPSPAATESSLAADIDVGRSGLDAEQLRAAIARELGVDVRLSSGKAEPSALLVRLSDGRATVRFQPPGGGRALERTVELPADPEPAYETVALLAGNLARDEASELLEQLRRKAAATSTATSDGSPATPENPTPPPAARRETEAAGADQQTPTSIESDGCEGRQGGQATARQCAGESELVLPAGAVPRCRPAAHRPRARTLLLTGRSDQRCRPEPGPSPRAPRARRRSASGILESSRRAHIRRTALGRR